MRSFSLTHLSDAELRQALPAAAARERALLEAIRAHVAEFKARGLPVPPEVESIDLDAYEPEDQDSGRSRP